MLPPDASAAMIGRQLVTRLMWLSGLSAVARRTFARKGSFVLGFHGIASRRYDELPYSVQPTFDQGELRTILSWVEKRFRFLTPEELLGGEPSGVLLTFDDGFANNRRCVLPLLEDFGAYAVFFVTTQHVREPRNWLPAIRDRVLRVWPRCDDVPDVIARDLYDGMDRTDLRACAEHPRVTVASHTVHHPFLTRADDRALARELEESKHSLEAWGGRRVDLFAYPKGDYDLRVARAVRDAGYSAAFAEDSKGVGLPDYEIHRVGLYSHRPAYLAAKLSGLHRRPWQGAVTPRDRRSPEPSEG